MQSKTPDKKAPAGASPAPAANRTKGILFILSAIVAAFLAAFILMRSGEKFYIPRTSLMDMFLRCSIGTMGILCNFWAVDHMRIADANILNKLSPFFAILMSIFILKERPNRVEWLSVLLAFIGAAFVAKPGAGIASFPALVAILGGFTAGTAYTYVRKLGLSGVKGPVIVFSFSVFSTLILLPNILLNYHPMSVKQFVFLVLAGCSAAIAQLSVTAAYQNAPARDISVFDYSQVVYAAMFGFLLWGEIPDAWSFLGYAIIIGTAFGKWYWMMK